MKPMFLNVVFLMLLVLAISSILIAEVVIEPQQHHEAQSSSTSSKEMTHRENHCESQDAHHDSVTCHCTACVTCPVTHFQMITNSAFVISYNQPENLYPQQSFFDHSISATDIFHPPK